MTRPYTWVEATGPSGPWHHPIERQATGQGHEVWFPAACERRTFLPVSAELILSASGIVWLCLPVRTRGLRLNRGQVAELRDLLDHVLALGVAES
jgi:hypothetical protein